MALLTIGDLSPLVWYHGGKSLIAHDAATSISRGSISQVYDLMPGGNHCAQSTGARQPETGADTLNGINVIKADSDFLSLTTPLSTVRSAIFVVDKLSLTGSDVAPIFGVGDNAKPKNYTFVRTNTLDYSISVDGAGVTFGSASANGGSKASGLNLDLGLSIAEKSGPVQFYVEFDAAIDVDDILAFYNSSQSALNGNLAEMAFFDRVLTEEDYFKATGAAAHEWGLTPDLPIDHPYKDGAPLSPVSVSSGPVHPLVKKLTTKLITTLVR